LLVGLAQGKVGLLKKKLDSYLLLLLALALVVFLRELRLGELHFNNDETRHAMTGVFFHDLIKDAPWRDLDGYTWHYYARYPALGIIAWPPFFYAVEALFYFALGITPVAGRLAIILFSLIGLIFWYKLVRRMYGTRIAFFGSLLFVTNPYILLYSKVIMLEIPSLALSVAAIYFFYTYLERNKKTHAYYWAISFTLAIMTKIHTIFLVPMFLLYVFVKKRWDIFKRREVLQGILIVALVTVPYNIFAFKVQSGRLLSEVTRGSAIESPFLNWKGYLFYILHLPEQLGWIVLMLSVLYVLLVLIGKQEYRTHSLFLIWILCCFALFFLIAQKAPRFTIYWIPPFLLFAVLFIDRLPYYVKGLRLANLALSILSVVLVVQAISFKKEYVRGYEEAARFIVEHEPKNATLFFHGYYDGNFLFHLRKYDPERKQIVLIGTKTLASINIFTKYGVDQHAFTRADIERLFSDYGTKYIVIEDLDLVELPGKLPGIFNILRDMMKCSQFKLVKKIPIDTNIARYRDRAISIYENTNHVELKKKFIQFHMLTLGGRTVTVPIE
jgi:uncharacterized membrane protein